MRRQPKGDAAFCPYPKALSPAQFLPRVAYGRPQTQRPQCLTSVKSVEIVIWARNPNSSIFPNRNRNRQRVALETEGWITITIRSRELELLEHQAKQGRFAEFRSFVIVVQRMEDHLVFRSAREGRLAGGSAFTVSP